MEPGTYLPSDNPRVPAAQHPFYHCLPVQMRFTDVDMLGHLNNNVYLSFMDLAKIDYFTKIMDGKLDYHSLNMVVVHIDCDFYSPSYFPEALEVWTTIVSVGKRSFVLEQRIVNAATGQTKCVGRTVMSAFDPTTTKSMPINDEWVHIVEKFEGRRLR